RSKLATSLSSALDGETAAAAHSTASATAPVRLAWRARVGIGAGPVVMRRSIARHGCRLPVARVAWRIRRAAVAQAIDGCLRRRQRRIAEYELRAFLGHHHDRRI